MTSKNYLGGQLSPWQSPHQHSQILFSATSYRFDRNKTQNNSQASPWKTSKSMQKYSSEKKKYFRAVGDGRGQDCEKRHHHMTLKNFKIKQIASPQKNLSNLSNMNISLENARKKRQKKTFTFNFIRREPVKFSSSYDIKQISTPLTSKSVLISSLLRKQFKNNKNKNRELRAYSVFL